MSMSGGERPRQLRWYHAGPMLFGDLGTSRLYVLGLAFYFTRHASFFHIIAVNLLLVLVSCCYLIICRKYPEGGGVYSSARHSSKMLAVIGGLMLCADYTVTAALSCLDAFRYLGVEGDISGFRVELACTLGAIGALGIVNWFGPRGMGRVAMVVALATIFLTLVVGLCALPHLHHMRVEFPVRERYSLSAWGDAWVGFTEIVLALSGIEAIANMTGIMVPPVRVTSRRSILPVLLEVVVMNLILAAAMNALPDAKLIDPEGNPQGTDNMMAVLATAYVGPTFSFLASFVFGALLLSGVNTAVTDLMAVQYMMARDGEAPAILTKLNRHGVPGFALVTALLIPAFLLVLFPDITQLAGLYSVGVVAAITINLLATGYTRQFQLGGWERWMLIIVGGLMGAILLTLLWTKPTARAFSLAILNMGLAARMISLASQAKVPGLTGPAFQLTAVLLFLSQAALTYRVPPEDWLFLFLSVANTVTLAVLSGYLSRNIPEKMERPPLENLDGDYDPTTYHLVAANRPSGLIQGVLEDAQKSRAGVVLVFVRHLSPSLAGSGAKHTISDDEDAREVFEPALAVAKNLGVPLDLVYLPGGPIAERIAQTAIDRKASRVYAGLPSRKGIMRLFRGDVIGPLAELLPENIELVVRG